MGEIPNPDGVGTASYSPHGDLVIIYIKVREGLLEDVKFKALGCGAAIATSSAVTEMARGRRLEEARRITREEVAERLGGLPPSKVRCSALAAEGLNKAIDDYLKKSRGDHP